MIKTIQMTIDETLLEEVDSTSAELGMNRSAFIREALRQAMERFRMAELERKHAAGYSRRYIGYFAGLVPVGRRGPILIFRWRQP